VNKWQVYAEEKKKNPETQVKGNIPPVAASEKGRAQTRLYFSGVHKLSLINYH